MQRFFEPKIDAARRSFHALLIAMSALSQALAQPGSLDMSFDPGEGVDYAVYTLAIQSGNRILIGGAFEEFDGIRRDAIARLNGDGSLDTSFQASLEDIDDGFVEVRSIAIQPGDGKILVGGAFSHANGIARENLARFSPDGVLDTTLTIMADDWVYAIVATPGGNNYLAGDYAFLRRGTTTPSRNYVARINGNDVTNWNVGGNDEWNGPDFSVYTLAVQPDGAVLIGGDFKEIWFRDDTFDRRHIARLLANNGRNDATFNPGSGANDTVYAIALQADGKVLVGGSFTQFNGARHEGIVRLLSNGSPDPTFNPQCGPGKSVYAIAVQPDGRVLIGGDFEEVSGHHSRSLARLLPDGAIDPEFRIGDDLEDGEVWTIALQADGQILIGGDFFTVADQMRSGIARINGDHAPRLASVPASQAAFEGAEVQFSVSASSDQTLTYQWFKDEEPLVESSRVRGVTAATLTIAGVELDDEGVYTVAVGNGVGAVISPEAELSVDYDEVWLGSPALFGSEFQFRFEGPALGRVVVLASEDLRTWQPVQPNEVSGAVIAVPQNAPWQFYRLRFEP